MTHQFVFQMVKQLLKSGSNTKSLHFAMKLVIKFLFINSIICSILLGQNNAQVQSRIEGTDRTQNSINNQIGGTPDSSADEVASSDTGAQRPVSLTDDEISAFFGYDSKYFYRSNPLFVNGDLGEETKSDMWTNTFFSGVSSVIEGDNSAYTPFLTTSYTVNDYLEDDLSIFNYNTTSVSTGVFSYYGGRNTYFARVIYNMDRSTENDTEDFSEFFTEVGLITSFQIVDSLGLNSTFGVGKHSSTIDSASGSRPEDLMDNLELSATNVFSFGNSFLDDLGLTYRISYQSYENGTYSDREDFSHSFYGKYGFTVFEAEQPNLFIFSSYSLRNSNENTFDYDNVDAGIGINLTANF